MINLLDQTTWPKLGSVWSHRNGNVYRVIKFTNKQQPGKEGYPTTIVYRNVENREEYSRRLDDWERSMTWMAEAPLVLEHIETDRLANNFVGSLISLKGNLDQYQETTAMLIRALRYEDHPPVIQEVLNRKQSDGKSDQE